MEELAELLSRYDRKKKYYRLKNGEFIEYDQDSLNAVSDMLHALQVSEKNAEKKARSRRRATGPSTWMSSSKKNRAFPWNGSAPIRA